MKQSELSIKTSHLPHGMRCPNSSGTTTSTAHLRSPVASFCPNSCVFTGSVATDVKGTAEKEKTSREAL